MQCNIKKLFKWVVAAHIAVIAFIALPVSFQSCQQEEYEVIPVRIVQESALAEDLHTAPTPETPPPEPDPAEPTPTPPPPTPDNDGAEVPPPRPENRLRTAEEIRRTAALDPVTPPQPQRDPRPRVDPAQLQARLQKRLDRIAANVTINASEHTQDSARETEYAESVLGPILYRRWNEPSLLETGGARPATRVELVIAHDGTVISSRIIQPSNNAAMESTIRTLLRAVKRVPAPRDSGIEKERITVTIKFEVTP